MSKRQLLKLEKKKSKKSAKRRALKNIKDSDVDLLLKTRRKLLERSAAGKEISEDIELIKDLLSLLPKLLKYIRITEAKINVTVATDDAAKTAITYGVVSQSVAYIVEALNNLTDFRCEPEISVDVDYTSGKSSADIKLKLSFRIWQLIYLAYCRYAIELENK